MLREAVESVMTQSLENWELIIVSDGSSDDFSDVESSDERIKVLRQGNRGVSIARNVGISLAESELIALLDEDDRMLPDRLSRQISVLKDQDVGLCHTQFEFIDDDSRIIGAGKSNDAQYRDFLRGDGAILLSSVMMRKSIFFTLGAFNPLLPLAQDLDLFYRVAREYPIAFIPEVLAQYRLHRANTWAGTMTGGEEYKHVVKTHLLIAESRQETENVRAALHGLSLVAVGRKAKAIGRISFARMRNQKLRLLSAYLGALLVAPVLTVRLTLRDLRR
jgi:glycosyltransferase involved in cell wall biosynthesis